MRRLVMLEIGLVAAVAALGAIGILFPEIVPEVPKSGGPLAVGVVVVELAYQESGAGFDPRCVSALEQVLAHEALTRAQVDGRDRPAERTPAHAIAQ